MWISTILFFGGHAINQISVTNFLHFEIIREICGLVLILGAYVFLLRGNPRHKPEKKIVLLNWIAVAIVGIYFGYYSKHYFTDAQQCDMNN